MRLTILFAATVVSCLSAFAQQPSCSKCSATYIPESEVKQYADRGKAQNVIDQQIRAVDIGKGHVAVGVVYRGKLSGNSDAAEHDLVSEVYHVISGSATLLTGWDIENMQRRPADNRAVQMLNGPGNNGTNIRNGASYNLKAGDVIVIPAGVGHKFTRIDDHIEYLMIRMDPDEVTPLKDAAASAADLKAGVADTTKGKAKGKAK